MGKQGKERLDVLLVQLGEVESREKARALIMAGMVFVDEKRVDKPGTKIKIEAKILVKGGKNPFVSRGGLKLDGALKSFDLDVKDRVAMDVGASTGGFTDCILQRGASKVYAVDVGYGQLAWKLRQDERVVNIERTNIRKLDHALVEEKLGLVVADCSFISLTKVLPYVLDLLEPGADLVVLVKPQFEAGRERLGKGGVVRDEKVRQEIIAEVAESCTEMGLEMLGGVDSEVHGPKGNREHLFWLRFDPSKRTSFLTPRVEEEAESP